MRRLLIATLLAAMALGAIQAASGAVISGTAGADRLRGTAFDDELYGFAGNDTLDGRAGNDLLHGGLGRDRLLGSVGSDWFAASGDGRVDTVRCGSGLDVVNAERSDRVSPDCDVVSRQLSRDAERASEAQHETQVEPDSHAFGSTIVTVFQSGRYSDGGAANIGFATSRDAGRTWRSGVLPGVSAYSKPPGSSFPVSDPAVAYDAAHRWWLAASLTSTGILISRSRDGVTWRMPVSATAGATGEYDKEWIVCDNWSTSRFRGRCYVSYMNFATNVIETRRSADGGATWSRPVTVDANRPGAVVNGVQPVARPDGDLLLVFSVFAALDFGSEIAVTRSTDGGVSFSPPRRIAPLRGIELPWMRAPSFASVDVDAAGTVYAAWSEGCATDECAADIVLARSADGVNWSQAALIPIAAFGRYGDHFLPGLAVDPATSGGRARIALLYHSMGPSFFCDPVSCLRVDVGMTVSRDGGKTWTSPQQLNAVPMSPLWMADTSLGRMLGDYVSVSWVRNRPIPVYSLASAPTRGAFQQAIFATTRMPTATAR